MIEETTVGMVTHRTYSNAKQRTGNRPRLFVLYQPDRSRLRPEMAPTISTSALAYGIRAYAFRSTRSRLRSDVIELNGTVTTRPIWGGRARLEEIEANGPKGHWEGLSVFLYNPQSHQWSQSFLNCKTPVMSEGLVGE